MQWVLRGPQEGGHLSMRGLGDAGKERRLKDCVSFDFAAEGHFTVVLALGLKDAGKNFLATICCICKSCTKGHR
jgi:hypothetical protein